MSGIANPQKFACISVDLDGLWCYRDIHGLPSRPSGPDQIDAAYSVGLRRLLHFFHDEGITSTLFAIGRDADNAVHSRMLREARTAGHEIASHSYAHDYGLRHQEMWQIREDLERAHHAIGEAVGQAPVGFRAPGYNVDARILSVCAELEYEYDSSVFPCPPYWLAKAGVMAWLAATRRPSRSSMTRPDTLLAPLVPYQPHAVRFWQHTESSRLPIEVPIAVLPGVRVPLIGTSLHLLGAGGFRRVMKLIRRTHRRIFGLEFHAIDFMDDRDPGTEDLRGIQPDLSIPWERKRELYEAVFAELRHAAYRFETLHNAVRSLD